MPTLGHNFLLAYVSWTCLQPTNIYIILIFKKFMITYFILLHLCPFYYYKNHVLSYLTTCFIFAI